MREGAISVASSLSILGLISSGPEALLGLRPFSILRTPGSVMLISGRIGKTGLEGSSWFCFRSFVNTDLNWLFNISAFLAGSEWRIPWSLSGEIPEWLERQCFMYIQNLFDWFPFGSESCGVITFSMYAQYAFLRSC